MEKKNVLDKKNLLFTLVLIGGVVFCINLVRAFSGPTASVGSGNGAIGVNTTNGISVGTPNTASNTKMYVLSTATPTNSKYGFQIVSPTGTRIFSVRNDGKVMIATSSPYAPTSTLTVWGDIKADNFFSGGTNPYSGFIGADEVTQGVFAGATADSSTEKFSFPSSLGIGTTTISNLPHRLSVYGNGYISGSLLANCATSFTTSTVMEVKVAPFTTGMRLTTYNGIPSSISFVPATFFGFWFATMSTTHPWGLVFGSLAPSGPPAPPYKLFTATSGVVINGGFDPSAKQYALDVIGSLNVRTTSTFSARVMINTTTRLSSTSTFDIVTSTLTSGVPTTAAYATDFCVIVGATHKCVSDLGPSGGSSGYFALWKTSASLTTSTISDNTSTKTVDANLKVTSSAAFKIVNGALSLYNASSTGGGQLPIRGAGIRMVFVPREKSFMAGEVSGDQWDDTRSLSARSYLFGYNTENTGGSGNSIIFGDSNTNDRGTDTFAIGSQNSLASAFKSFIAGSNNSSTGSLGFIYGTGNTLGGRSSGAMAGGTNTFADDTHSLVLGSSTEAQGRGSNTFAAGESSIAHGGSSIALGLGVTASGTGAFAIGNGAGANTDANSALAFGRGAYANAPNSYAFGGDGTNIPQATANKAVTFGVGITNSEDNSIAFGLGVGNFTVSQISGVNALVVVGGNLGIGAVAPKSTLEVAGPITLDSTLVTNGTQSLNKTDPYSILFVDTSITVGPSVTINLPFASDVIARTYYIYKVDSLAKQVIIQQRTGDNILLGGSGTTSTLTSQYQGVELIGLDNNNWISLPFSS